jgi:hypothetical protein
MHLDLSSKPDLALFDAERIEDASGTLSLCANPISNQRFRIALRASRGFPESGFVIRHKFLDAFSRQLMLNIDLLPRLLQVQLLIGNFRADRLVRKVVTRQWHSFFCPLFQNPGRNGYKLRVDVKRVKQLLNVADTGS